MIRQTVLRLCRDRSLPFLFLLLAFSEVSQARKNSSSYIRKAMKAAFLVPMIIDRAPLFLIGIKYGDKDVRLGNTLNPTEVQDPPSSLRCDCWDSNDPNKFHTLVMIDPDVPSKAVPLLRSFKHWLVVNIPGNNITKGEALTEYRGSEPPLGSGFHRYLFLIFRQPGKVDFYKPKNGKDNRMNFPIKRFARKYKLGTPIAGNFFQAEWDPAVPSLLDRFRTGQV